jgi:4-diphosphocytidyl-2-C-methyl-D-erythritol kinase
MAGRTAIDTFAHAKLNLSLRVLARETTGYHQIETLFCALELADEIAISRTSGGVSLAVDLPTDRPGATPDLGPIEENLAYRAAALFMQEAPLARGVHVRLVKRIPAGAGLGGGSSDAAAVLCALNELRPKPIPAQALLELGARLGSDVPFFITGAPLALAWGRGERIAPLPPLAPAAVVLAVPPERVATADAYAAFAAEGAPSPMIVRIPASWSDVADLAHNDFEATVFALHPRLGAVRAMLEDGGANIARLTGTGSVVFGLFADAAGAAAAADRITDAYPDIDTIVTQTRTAG